MTPANSTHFITRSRTCRRSRTRRAILSLAVLFATFGTIAQAQTSETATSALEALETWTSILNDKDLTDAALKTYVSESFAPEFLAQVPLDQAVGFHQQLRAAAPFGPAQIVESSDQALVAKTQANGGPWFEITLNVSAAGKIDGLLVQPTNAPEDHASAKLPDWKDLNELAAHVAAESGLPGLAIAWAHADEAPKVGVAGLRAVAGASAVQPDDRFHIGSITKSVTSTVLAALVQEEKLKWTDTLETLLPDVSMRPEYRHVELQTLVRHRAQIPQHLTFDEQEMSRLNGLEGTPAEQRASYVAEILNLEPIDEGFHYSNAGYAVAGHIAERVGGASWFELVRTKVFEPLALSSCGLGWPATEATPEQPRGHSPGANGLEEQALDAYELGAFMSPAGDLHCSVADLARYGQAHLKGLSGLDGFLTAATIEELHRVPADSPYAAGWGVDPDTGEHQHNGSAGTFFSYLTIDPETRTVIAVLTNTGPAQGQAAAQKIADAVFSRTE